MIKYAEKYIKNYEHFVALRCFRNRLVTIAIYWKIKS